MSTLTDQVKNATWINACSDGRAVVCANAHIADF